MAIREYLAKIAAVRRKEDLRNCKFFLENYGKFQVWCGMYPAYWWHTIFYLLVLISHDGFLAYTAFIGMEDLALFAESTHFVIMIAIMIVGVLNISIYKENNEEIFWALEHGLHNYQDTVDEESHKQIEEFREEVDARKKLYSKVIAYTMYSACIMLCAVRPMFEYLSGKYDNAKYDDGITRWMPVACWLPYDTSKWHFYILALLSEYYIIIFGTCTVIANDVVFLRLAEELVYELRVMTLLLQNIRKRTEFVMENKLKIVPRNLDKNPAWTHCVRLCLTHSVQHHVKFIKMFANLNEMLYYLLFFLLFGSVYLLCLCGVLFTSDDVELAPKFTFAVFMGGELVNTFIFCWYGQQIQDKNGELRDVIYNTDWFEYSTAIKHHFLMMQMRSLNELKLSAGGFTDLSLSTFGNVLNSAYSYFNLFRASREIN